MIIDCITIFPEMFAPMKSSIMGRAQAKGLFEFSDRRQLRMVVQVPG